MAAGGALDPEDWPAFRAQAHALLDRLIDGQRDVADGPVWRSPPDEVRRRLAEASPSLPQGTEAVIQSLTELVLPYGTGNTHPRFWGWVHGTGTPGGMLAEMAAAAINANCGGRDHGAILVERTVIDWARSWFGFPPEAAGLVVGGTSMANLLGLAVARDQLAGRDVRADGLAGLPLVGYASVEAHSCVTKAFEALGLGRNALRLIPVDADYRLEVAALAAAITADRQAGHRPFCVIGSAGTVTTGATDDLAALARLCRAEGLWLHVDGAFGALAILSPELAPRLAGIELADSLGFDFHKWLHAPYAAGCLLVRDGARLQATFGGGRPAYLAAAAGLAGGEPWPCDFGLDLSRGFGALKVWFTVKEHGTSRLGQAIARNCAQARALAALIGENPPLRLMAPVPLQIVCCRYQPAGLDDEAADRLNAQLVAMLQTRGIAAPSTCRIGGRLCIRICITNHRTRDADLPVVVEAMLAIGAELAV